MLVLPIKKKWFDMIASGEKKEEYRAFKEYYTHRLPRHFGGGMKTLNGLYCEWSSGDEKEVVFRNGYGKKVPQIKCLCTLEIGTGKQEWGAEQGKTYYVLKILQVLGDDK